MRKRFPVEEDPAGLSQAVREFNSHEGPARIFYNRNSRTFFTRLYPDGGDRWFGPMTDGLDIVELYRKTSDFPDVKVTDTELRVLESEIGQYAVW
ncbi:MAG: hypothetical protein IKN41_07050 [Candidatus Methanomethylophilaceae archaeon]|jgi:hypothetical protein|nr:hypothetical protein [Candidatus Methanomethylophilaceae archaeon]